MQVLTINSVNHEKDHIEPPGHVPECTRSGKDHQSTWSGVPAFVNTVDQFESLLNELNNRLNQQNTVTQGITKDKEAFMDQLIRDISYLKKGLFLHATQTNNLILLERHRESLTKLKSMGAERLKIVSATLLEDLETYESFLTSVGIDAQRIQEFRDMATVLEERKNSVRQAIIERSIETKSIRELEKQLNALLINQLDRFISLFQSTNKPFFDTYKASRKIIGNNGGPKNGPKGSAAA
ncbi:MAG: hypothetical protein K0S23_1339 [Fluviicola sp.]|jgi:hypothetical protein|uniref:hypothetical protein n=1 Tax=Fluviicola sp. TaxID=1917219 RepID=UPI00261181BE|nr:hypothetical protein [Fluviicola sp.]MDF3027032.1 hypothetical protein [Fluviicola sp.]